MLHLEIVTERLRREFDQELVVTTPSITYEVTLKNGRERNGVHTDTLSLTMDNIPQYSEPWILIDHHYTSRLCEPTYAAFPATRGYSVRFGRLGA
jgi:translation elongation factor EF-4